jgi:hypothetical protein
MTLDEIRLALSADRNASAIARATGLGVRKVLAIRNGHGEPKHSTVLILQAYFAGQKANDAA